MSAAPWVVMGGGPGESAYCKRCGVALRIELPVHIEVWAAAADAFVKVHARCKDTGRVEAPPADPMAWLAGRDTGVSSTTIWHAIMHRPLADEDASVPWDPDDFGRCYRLLKLFPHWREGLREVANRWPKWGPLVREWDRLTALFEEEEPTGTAPKLYAAMHLLHVEAGIYGDNHDCGRCA